MAGAKATKVCNRPQDTPAAVRLRAIKAQLSAAVTLCALAEGDISNRRIDNAHLVIERVRHTINSVRQHLDEPNQVSPSSLPEVRDQLAQMQERVLALQSRLDRLR